MSDTLSQRVAYGEMLVDLGRNNEDVVVLEADLSKSTMGTLFEAAYPDRFFEMGIAESNMISTAAGLSLMGKIPFSASFAVFSTGRCYDQIRTSICIPGLNVKICGSSAGLSDFGDGSTHQSIDDIALMRVLPNMSVFSPVDAVQTRLIVKYMAENPGPMYIRLNRNDLPIYTDEKQKFIPGEVYTLQEGSDVAVFATGIMVSKALEASAILAQEGISVKVVNVPTIKPLSAEDVIKAAKAVKCVVTAEEHSVIGGLGSAISDALTDKVAVKIYHIGIMDKFGTSAHNYDQLVIEYGLTKENIADTIRMAIKKL